MGTYPNVLLIDEYVLNIHELAVFGLSDDDVEGPIVRVIGDAYFYFSHSMQCDFKSNLLSLKGRLQKTSDAALYCFPAYKKSLEYAISLIDVNQAAYRPKKIPRTGETISHFIKK